MRYDTQRKRLEAAEAAAADSFALHGFTEYGARRFLRMATTSDWWRRRFPEIFARHPAGLPLEVELTRLSAPSSGPAGITVSAAMLRRGQVSRLLLLHETAHIVAGAQHGRDFAAVLLVLWQHHLGVKARRRLRVELADRRVLYRKRKQLAPDVLERLRLHGLVSLGRMRRLKSGLWAPPVRTCCGLPMVQAFEASGCLHSCSGSCRRSVREALGPELPA